MSIKTRADIFKVGITGAAGNIGKTLTEGLADKYELSLFDVHKLRGGFSGTFRQVDFGNMEEVRGKFEGLDAIIHLAGDPRPNAPSHLTLRNNFAAASYVFEEARRAGVKKVVFASSNFYHQGSVMEILNDRTQPLIRLDTPPTPQCLYGQSKVYGETIGRHMAYLGIQFVAIRIGWTVPEDNPVYYGGPYMNAIFCSKRDLVDVTDKSLTVDSEYLVVFGTSNNDSKIFDLEETGKLIGFYPQDNSANY